MKEARFYELLAAEMRIARCGCGGACWPCQNEKKPEDENEMMEFEEELDVRGLR